MESRCRALRGSTAPPASDGTVGEGLPEGDAHEALGALGRLKRSVGRLARMACAPLRYA